MTTSVNPESTQLHPLSETSLSAALSDELKGSSSEIGAIAQGIGDVIQGYNNRIHDELEGWYETSKKLDDLIKFLKPTVKLLMTLKKASASENNVCLSGKDASFLLELGNLFGEDFSKNVPVGSCSITYKDGTVDIIGTCSLDDAINTIVVNEKYNNEPLAQIESIEITIHSYDTEKAENALKSALDKNGHDLGSLTGISQAITSLKNKQNQYLFKVMALSNAKKSNQNTLSSIIQTLRSIASTTMGNV